MLGKLFNFVRFIVFPNIIDQNRVMKGRRRRRGRRRRGRGRGKGRGRERLTKNTCRENGGRGQGERSEVGVRAPESPVFL